MEKDELHLFLEIIQVGFVAYGLDQISAQYDIELGKIGTDTVEPLLFNSEDVNGMVGTYFDMDFTHAYGIRQWQPQATKLNISMEIGNFGLLTELFRPENGTIRMSAMEKRSPLCNG